MKFPPLVITSCPLGCDLRCARKWINDQIDHIILCQCECHKSEKKPELNLTSHSTLEDIRSENKTFCPWVKGLAAHSQEQRSYNQEAP